MKRLATSNSNSRRLRWTLGAMAATALVTMPASDTLAAGQPTVVRIARSASFSLPPAPPATRQAPPAVNPVPVPVPKAIPRQAPTPGTPAPAASTPQIEVGPVIVVPAVRLYRCVKYKDTDEIPEDAIPLVIQVPDPRGIPSFRDSFLPPIAGCAFPRGCAYPAGCAFPAGCAYPRGCAQPLRPRMVNIKICAPRCAIDCLRVGQHVLSSRRIRYNFGDFKVDIRLRSNGWIEVKYDD